MLVFEERESRSTRTKTSRCRVENQQTQPTHGAESSNRTRVILVLTTTPFLHPQGGRYSTHDQQGWKLFHRKLGQFACLLISAVFDAFDVCLVKD